MIIDRVYKNPIMHDESELAEQSEQPSPRPIAEPSSVDFGTVRRGESPRQKVQIDNANDLETSVQVKYLEPNSWFRIVGVEPIDDERTLPIVVEIEADTRHLRLNQTYESAIIAVMDGVRAPIRLRIRVVRFHFPFLAQIGDRLGDSSCRASDR